MYNAPTPGCHPLQSGLVSETVREVSTQDEGFSVSDGGLRRCQIISIVTHVASGLWMMLLFDRNLSVYMSLLSLFIYFFCIRGLVCTEYFALILLMTAGFSNSKIAASLLLMLRLSAETRSVREPQRDEGGEKERKMAVFILATYFSGAFVFDGELALLLAVIDVAELVVEQVRGRRQRRRQTGEQHREQSRGAAHPATRDGGESMGRGEER